MDCHRPATYHARVENPRHVVRGDENVMTILRNIQLNASFFRRLRWRGIEKIGVRGRPQLLIQADLRFYPPADVARSDEHRQVGAAS